MRSRCGVQQEIKEQREEASKMKLQMWVLWKMAARVSAPGGKSMLSGAFTF